MSAGQNLRRGYAYGVSTAVSAPTLGRRSASPDVFSLVVIATMILVIAAVASDPALSASIGRIFGTAWSDSIRFLMGVVNRGAQ